MLMIKMIRVKVKIQIQKSMVVKIETLSLKIGEDMMMTLTTIEEIEEINTKKEMIELQIKKIEEEMTLTVTVKIAGETKAKERMIQILIETKSQLHNFQDMKDN